MNNQQNKKILLVYRHYLSLRRGTPLRVNSLIKELSDSKKFEVHTCTRDDSVDFGISHKKLSGIKIKDVWIIHRYLIKRDIGIVVFHTLDAAYYLIPLKFLHPKKKFVLEMHGFLEEEALLHYKISTFKYYRNKFFYALIYKSCDAISTCSETASDVVRKYNNNVTTIFGGVDLEKFNPTIKPRNGDVKKDNEIVIGYSGNSRQWQGLDFLLNAFTKLVALDSSFSLKLLLSEDIVQPEIPNVTISPSVPHDEVGYFSAACDILVIPRPENVVNTISFPSKLMEFLAMGKPVVGSRTSDIHQIIKHGENGLLYEPGDSDALVECILSLKDSSLREKLGGSGYQTVKISYTWEIQGKKFCNLIDSLKINTI